MGKTTTSLLRANWTKLNHIFSVGVAGNKIGKPRNYPPIVDPDPTHTAIQFELLIASNSCKAELAYGHPINIMKSLCLGYKKS
ncbi:hypothetical protein SCA6_004035 [Theobroma cacao]